MKKILFLALLAVGMIVNAQFDMTIDLEDIIGNDTILKSYGYKPYDVSTYNWRCLITIEPTDTVIVGFGGRINGGKYHHFQSDSIPYTMYPSQIMSIEANDTTYEKLFTGGNKPDGMYGLKIFEIYIDPLNSTGDINIKTEFYKP
jgi:hypothetical protein